MRIFALILAAISALVLGAHFLRDGNTLLTVVSVAIVTLLFVRQPWARRVVQAALLLGFVEWIRTLVSLIQVRQAMGMPFGRMLLILGLVALVTAGSALLLQLPAVAAHFRDGAAVRGHSPES